MVERLKWSAAALPRRPCLRSSCDRMNNNLKAGLIAKNESKGAPVGALGFGRLSGLWLRSAMQTMLQVVHLRRSMPRSVTGCPVSKLLEVSEI